MTIEEQLNQFYVTNPELSRAEVQRRVREWALAEMGGGEDEGWAWIKRKLLTSVPELALKQRLDDCAGTKYEIMGWMHVLCSYAQAANNCYLSIAVEQERRADHVEAELGRARDILTNWANKQGQDRCWYFPELFGALAVVLGVKVPDAPLVFMPPREEFEAGCKRYQDEQYAQKSGNAAMSGGAAGTMPRSVE